MQVEPKLLSEVELERLGRVKRQQPSPIAAMGPQLLEFFKNGVQKRQGRLASIAQCWLQLVPEHLLEHCALESFHAGTLKVFVDSSAHLYDLKQLLLAGLQQQMLLACKSSGLRQITLKRGRWYDGEAADRRIRF